MLKTTSRTPNLDRIDAAIHAAPDLKTSADVIAQSKKQILNILQTEIAEGIDDETLLQKLQDKLQKKKDLFEKELGKGIGLPASSKLDFGGDQDLINFWKDYVDGKCSTSPTKVSPTERKAFQGDIKDSLKNLQRLDVSNASWTLFGGATFDIANITKNVKHPEIVDILDAKKSSVLDKKIETFIKRVSGTHNTFHIQHSKLYHPADDNQRRTALRVALYLYCLHKAADNKDLDQATFLQMKEVLNKQINEIEIPKFKGIYNVKKSLEYVEPEYEMLRDINVKRGDITLAGLQYGTSVETSLDLTPNFEHGQAVNIDQYSIDTSLIQPAGMQLVNSFGSTNLMSVQLGDKQDFDLVYTTAG